MAKLGWLVDHGLPVPDRWLGVPELALFLLTGTEATEHSLAARTGAYHVTERRFLPEVIAHVLSWPAAAPTSFFAAVGAAGSRWVRVGGGAAGYGLPAGIPVTIAGHDHLAAAAGLGARPDDLFNSVGTAETLVRRLDTAPDIDRALELDLAVTVWPGGEAWGVLASATRSGLVIDALAAHLGSEPACLDRLVMAGSAEPHLRRRRGDGDPRAGDRGACRSPAAMWMATLQRPGPSGRRPPPTGSPPWPGRTTVWCCSAAAAAAWRGDRPRSRPWESLS